MNIVSGSRKAAKYASISAVSPKTAAITDMRSTPRMRLSTKDALSRIAALARRPIRGDNPDCVAGRAIGVKDRAIVTRVGGGLRGSLIQFVAYGSESWRVG